jgi:5-methylcytosine-specific restriction endonuclease McrA
MRGESSVPASDLTKRPTYHFSAEWLTEQYVTLQKSAREMAAEQGTCSPSAITRALRDAGIPMRPATWKANEVTRQQCAAGTHYVQSEEARAASSLRRKSPRMRYIDSQCHRGTRHHALIGATPLNGYGSKWMWVKKLAILRDGNRCQICGATSADGGHFDTHHLVGVKRFAHPDMANYLGNLITVCMDCHRLFHAGTITDTRLTPDLQFSQPVLLAKWRAEFPSTTSLSKRTRATLLKA